MKAPLLNVSLAASVYLCLASVGCASDKSSTTTPDTATADAATTTDTTTDKADAASTPESGASVATELDASSPATAATGAATTESDAGISAATSPTSAFSASAATPTTPSAAPASSAAATPSEEDAAFAGTWTGYWLSSSGQIGGSKLTTMLDGTTVGGISEVDGTKKSTLSGTFMDGNFMGSFYSTVTFAFDLNVQGPFLVGTYGGGAVQLSSAVMRATSALPAPATFPTKLVGTWKSLTNADTNSITITVASGDGMLSGHIAAPGLADSDVSFIYNDGTLTGGNILVQTVLLASGNHFVGTFGNNTDIGVIDVMAE